MLPLTRRARRTFHVRCLRAADGWLFHIDELAHLSGRVEWLDDVEREARRMISSHLDLHETSITVGVDIETGESIA